MEIIKGNIIEFNFSENGFVLRYDVDENYWYAQHFDEDNYPDSIIIEDQFSENKFLLLFNYPLSKEMFEQFKIIVEREKNAIR